MSSTHAHAEENNIMTHSSSSSSASQHGHDLSADSGRVSTVSPLTSSSTAAGNRRGSLAQIPEQPRRQSGTLGQGGVFTPHPPTLAKPTGVTRSPSYYRAVNVTGSAGAGGAATGTKPGNKIASSHPSHALAGGGDRDPAAKKEIPHTRTETLNELEESYLLKDVIGQGAFGVVRLCEHKLTTKIYALKTVKKRQGSTTAYEQLQREIGIMKVVCHPNIVQLKEVYESAKKVVLIMEYCAGGELVQTVRKNGGCPIHEVQSVTIQLIEAVTYLHKHGIIHRDIKPENILLKSSNPADPLFIKVSDFGLACYADGLNHIENVAGTPMYMAPEILQKLGYSHTCDIWSIGVMLYLLLCNYKKDAETLVQEMIRKGKIEYPPKYWKDIPASAKNLCELILRFDPAKRISAGEILRHPWIVGESDTDDGGASGGGFMSANVLELMRSFNAELRLRKAMLVVLASVRLIRAVKARKESRLGRSSTTGGASSTAGGTARQSTNADDTTEAATSMKVSRSEYASHSVISSDTLKTSTSSVRNLAGPSHTNAAGGPITPSITQSSMIISQASLADDGSGTSLSRKTTLNHPHAEAAPSHSDLMGGGRGDHGKTKIGTATIDEPSSSWSLSSKVIVSGSGATGGNSARGSTTTQPSVTASSGIATSSSTNFRPSPSISAGISAGIPSSPSMVSTLSGASTTGQTAADRRRLRQAASVNNSTMNTTLEDSKNHNSSEELKELEQAIAKTSNLSAQAYSALKGTSTKPGASNSGGGLGNTGQGGASTALLSPNTANTIKRPPQMIMPGGTRRNSFVGMNGPGGNSLLSSTSSISIPTASSTVLSQTSTPSASGHGTGHSKIPSGTTSSATSNPPSGLKSSPTKTSGLNKTGAGDSSLPKLKLPQPVGIENNSPSGGLRPKKKEFS